MRDNYFYHYLKHYNTDHNCTISSNSSYFMIKQDFDASLPTGFATKEAHLTVYKSFDLDQEYLSAVHYSAYFSFDTRSEHRVHLYFDTKGKILSGPIYSVKHAGEEWGTAKIEANEAIEYLLRHALKVTPAWIQKTNKEIIEKIAQLEGAERTLKANYLQRPEQASLRKLIVNLEAQRDLQNNKQHLTSKLIRLHRIRAQVPTLTAIKPIVKTELDDNAYRVQNAQPEARQKTSSKERLVARLTKDQQEFTMLPPDEQKKEAVTYLDRHSQLNEENLKQLTTEQLSVFNQFLDELEAKGWEAFQEIWTAPGQLNQTELDKYSYFYSRLSQQHYIEAIKRQDATRLGLVLQHNDQLLEAPVKLGKNTRYNNLVEFCVNKIQKNQDIPFVTACVELLLKHDASFIVPMDDSDLTFLEWIQFQTDHPCYLAFANSHVWDNVETYIKLKHHLLAIYQSDASAAIKVKIDFYSVVIALLLKYPQSLQGEVKLKPETGWTIEERIKLNSDPELLEGAAKYIQTAQKILDKMPKILHKVKAIEVKEQLTKSQDALSAKLEDLPFDEKVSRLKIKLKEHTEALKGLFESPIAQMSLGMFKKEKVQHDSAMGQLAQHEMRQHQQRHFMAQTQAMVDIVRTLADGVSKLASQLEHKELSSRLMENTKKINELCTRLPPSL